MNIAFHLRAVASGLIAISSLCVVLKYAGGHEPESFASPIADKEAISAPYLPMLPPAKYSVQFGMPLPDSVNETLQLTSEYRRLFDYFLLLSENRRLDRHSISSELVQKTLEVTNEFVTDCQQVCAAMTAQSMAGDHDSADTLRRGLAKRFHALRHEYDRQILKHHGYVGIPLVTLKEGQITCDRKTIKLRPLAGTPCSLFALFWSDGRPGRYRIEIQEENGRPLSSSEIVIHAAADGLIPLSCDLVFGTEHPPCSLIVSCMPEERDDESLKLAIPIQADVVEPAVIELQVVDSASGEDLAARMQVKDRYGVVRAPLGSRTTEVPKPFGPQDWNTNYRFPGEKFFYGKGVQKISVPPGKTLVRTVRGFDYRVAEQNLNLAAGESRRVQVKLDRWIDMHQRGWWSGQTHVHSRNLMPVNDDSGWEIVPEAEGLDISYLLTFQQHGEIFTDEYPAGPLPHLSEPHRLLSVGEEFRHFSRGHMTFNGLSRIVDPISTGILFGEGGLENPSNAQAIEEAHRQGAIAAYAHLNSMQGFISSEELPIDAALGLVDAGEVMGAGGGYRYWYSILNCGLHVGATAGPDWNLEDCCRVYAHLQGSDFNEKNWLEALRQHRTFVTTGPMLFLTVNDQIPGSTISGQAAAKVQIRAEVQSSAPVDRVEIIANGQVLATKKVERDKTSVVLELEHQPVKNGWLAARCFGEGNAHTSPIYLKLNDEPNDAVEDARLLRGFAINALRRAQQSPNYSSEAAKEKVLALYKEGIAFYDSIIARGSSSEPRE